MTPDAWKARIGAWIDEIEADASLSPDEVIEVMRELEDRVGVKADEREKVFVAGDDE